MTITVSPNPANGRVKRPGASGRSRPIRSKVADTRNLRDFVAADDAARLLLAIAEGTGGIQIPTDAASLGNGEIGVNQYTLNDSIQDVSLFTYNVGETARNTVARHAKRVRFTGTNLTRRRVGNALVMETEGAGDNLANNGSADFGQLINVFKSNFRTTTNDGEIDGLTIVVRQGGNSAVNKSDAAGILIDTVTYSNRFATGIEGATATYSVGAPDVLTRRGRYFCGVIDNANDFATGFSYRAEIGATTAGLYLAEDAGAAFGDYILCLSANYTNGTVFRVAKAGTQTTNLGTQLATTANAEVIASDTGALVNNNDRVRSKIVRTAAGSDFRTAAWRMQRRVDVSELGYLEFGADASTGGSIVSIGYGAPGASSLLFSATQAGTIGFLGTTPVARTALGAAATDLPTVLVLANNIRTALRTMGLAT